MGEREGYEVLRLIEHNQKCYISSDYVEGKSLIQWLKYHPNLTKKQLFLWIRDLADQLECIHKCRGNPCYQYVNPYSVIVTEDMTTQPDQPWRADKTTPVILIARDAAQGTEIVKNSGKLTVLSMPASLDALRDVVRKYIS